MPKRSYDNVADMSTNGEALSRKIQKVPLNTSFPIQKTERSHEENQERAYIAASRRADRSIEARVQSARMASEIHRRRTGRGLKISEEIVRKEEMYDEMEEDLPRPYRIFNSHLQTAPQGLNNPVDSFVGGQIAMDAIAKYDEVERQFVKVLPHAAAYVRSRQDVRSRQNSRYLVPPLNNTTHVTPSVDSRYLVPPLNDTTHVTPSVAEATTASTSRKQSFSAQSQSPVSMPDASPGQISSTLSAPSPDISPVVTPTDTMKPDMPYHALQPDWDNAQPGPLSTNDSISGFTSKLAKQAMVVNFGANNPMAIQSLGNDPSSAIATPSAYDDGAVAIPTSGPNYYEGITEDGLPRFDLWDRDGSEKDVWEFFNDNTE